MNTQYEWIATAAFGLEGVVARELERLNIPARAENGGARFTASFEDAMRANLWLRCADRVLLVIGRFEARSFEELFEGVKALPWEDFIGRNTRFPVSGKCARSQLMSVRDCQAITKKAIVERLKSKYRVDWLEETEETVAIDVALHGDIAQLTLDASGVALNRRGYRTWNGEAPLRETLAAALVSLSPWRPGMRLHDPMCGTGTLMIEAAMRMANRAPGLTREFAIESWRNMPLDAFKAIREEALAAFNPDLIEGISGSDIDPEAVELANRHLKQAGLAGKVSFTVGDARECRIEGERGTFLCNPPYGERLSDRKACEELYREMGMLLRRHPGFTLSAITSHPGFERCFGRRADKKRRFYNGRLECEFMTFGLPAQKKKK
ncbi:MAG: class I SAM-dependent RNA methyltransferase [Clostridia bacterium]|nr:class I SAM-dependent RNA methyltransferase [Clostridia bacterium]